MKLLPEWAKCDLPSFQFIVNFLMLTQIIIITVLVEGKL